MKTLGLLLVLLPLAASAATITVDTTADNLIAGNGKCTLREAIANVNAALDTTGGDCTAGSGEGDTIRFGFGMPAKIRLKLGQLLIQRDVSIENPAPGALHIDGFGKSRVFEITAGTTSISNATIEHGRAATRGGGILVDNGATLNISDGVLTRNSAFADPNGDLAEVTGGGIFNAGTMSLTRCILTRNKVDIPDPEDNSGDTYGGAIHNEAGTLVLNACTLSKNAAVSGEAGEGYGGAISSRGGSVLLNGCLLSGNALRSEMPSYGGALFTDQDASAVLNDCTFNRNRNWGGGDSYSYGGAISNWGTMQLTGCTVTRNATVVKAISESYAGGIHNAGPMIMTDCTVAGNVALGRGTSADAFGGGIYNESYTDDPSSFLTMTRCTVSGNRTTISQDGSSWGAGIDNGGDLTMTNCTLAGNRATAAYSFDRNAAGGGIYNEVSMAITNCTLSSNTARPRNPDQEADGGGNLFLSGQATLVNTILANGGSGGNCFAENGDHTTSLGHNLSSDDTCFSAGGADVLNRSPQLGRLVDNGGATKTMALQPGSPAIDTGDDAVTGPPNNLTTDQRGLPRLRGAHVDIGAYEVQ